MKKVHALSLASLIAAMAVFASFVNGEGFIEPIVPDTSVYYSICPPCDPSFQSINGTGSAATAEKAVAVVEKTLDFLGKQDAVAATAQFCSTGALSWQGHSETLRNNTESIRNYQVFFATYLDGTAPKMQCVHAIELSRGLVRVHSFLGFADTPACERSTWTVDVDNDCIVAAYGSGMSCRILWYRSTCF
jgi:hypothetical protein